MLRFLCIDSTLCFSYVISLGSHTISVKKVRLPTFSARQYVVYNGREWTLAVVRFSSEFELCHLVGFKLFQALFLFLFFYICKWGDDLVHWVVIIDENTCKMVNPLNGSVSKVYIQYRIIIRIVIIRETKSFLRSLLTL